MWKLLMVVIEQMEKSAERKPNASIDSNNCTAIDG